MDDVARARHIIAMTRLILLDMAIRMLAIGQLLLITIVIGLGRAPHAIRVATALLLTGIASYLAAATPLFRPLDAPLWLIVRFSAQMTPWLLWTFAHLLFERPIDRRAALCSAAALVGCAISYLIAIRWAPGAEFWGTQFWIALIQHGISLVLIIQAIMIAFLERGDDLIEKRRRLRFGFVVLVGSIAFIVLVLEMLSGFRYSGLGIALGQSIAILIATTAVAVAFLQSDPELLFDPAEPAPEPKLSPSEHVLKRKLDAAIAGAIHREPGLSIGGLAERLGTPEHRLRSLINQRLGYRNFSAFLNHHRIAEAKTLLADPVHVDLPILTIAMDLGYGSLAPFNRAFRQETGQAPSNFRRAAIVEN